MAIKRGDKLLRVSEVHGHECYEQGDVCEVAATVPAHPRVGQAVAAVILLGCSCNAESPLRFWRRVCKATLTGSMDERREALAAPVYVCNNCDGVGCDGECDRTCSGCDDEACDGSC